MKECACKEWHENIEIVKTMQTLDPMTGKVSKFADFKYCTFCGKKLIDIKEESVK